MQPAPDSKTFKTTRTVDESDVDRERRRHIEACQGLVRSIAWKIHQRMIGHIELEELIAYGQVGLVQAAVDFDPGRKVKFTTYAYYRIRGAIFDGLSQWSWFNRREYHAGRYERLAGEVMAVYEQDASYSDSLAGDAEWFGDVSRALAVVHLMSGEDGGRFADSAIAAKDGDPSIEAAWQEMRGQIRTLISRLPAEPRELLRMVYVENQSLQAAASHLGVSRSWASRLHSRTLVRLAEAIRVEYRPSRQTETDGDLPME